MSLGRTLLVAFGLASSLSAWAGTAYRCHDPQGKVSYRETPCPEAASVSVKVPLPDSRSYAMPAAVTQAPPAGVRSIELPEGAARKPNRVRAPS